MPSVAAQDNIECTPIMENEVPMGRTPCPTPLSANKPKPFALASILSTSLEREDSYISAAQSIEDMYEDCGGQDDPDVLQGQQDSDSEDETDLNVYHQEVIV